jgi:hypothetical protein
MLSRHCVTPVVFIGLKELAVSIVRPVVWIKTTTLAARMIMILGIVELEGLKVSLISDNARHIRSSQ